jgi:hypothetical protein
MRITRDSLMTLARDFAAERFGVERDLMCIYLTGSMCSPSPLLGGTTDIDLVFVHIHEPVEKREIVGINSDVSFDIAHLGQNAFEQPRRLRLDPWLGSFLCENPVILKENKHWFEFTQAAVCAHFNNPDTVLARAKPLSENARRIWFSLQNKSGPVDAGYVCSYLNAVESAVNACACLYGAPLTERRFFIIFDELMEKENQAALSVLAKALVCSRPAPEEFWTSFLPIWKDRLSSLKVPANFPKKLSPQRLNYYYKACETLYSEYPASALWIMLRTWGLVEEQFPDHADWNEVLTQTGFTAPGLDEKLESLDRFLDLSDELFERWANFYGL